MNVQYIINNVERNSNVRIYIDHIDEDIEDCAWYIPEERAIGINPAISDHEAIESIIHEVAHHVDISENNHPDRRDIDGEIIAHAVEGIICRNEPIDNIIVEYEEPVREAYMFNGVVSIDEDDIREVAERVRIICNFV